MKQQLSHSHKFTDLMTSLCDCCLRNLSPNQSTRVCLFSCTALFVGIGQVIGCEDRLQNDLYCVGWGVKLCSTSTINSRGIGRLVRNLILRDKLRRIFSFNQFYR